MPRNITGTYSLYTPGNPVVPSTVISTTWANNSLSDIATALTDSLSRSGSGGMTAQLQHAAGAVGAPGISWTAETNSGLYRAGAGDFRYSISGVDVWKVTSAGVTSGFADGLVGTPSVYFTADLDTGLYRVAANTLGITTNGVLRLLVSATQIRPVSVPIQSDDGTAGAPAYSFDADSNTGLYRVGADSVGLSTGGTLRFSVDTAGVVSTLPVRTPDGAVGAPAHSFSGTTDMGMYKSGAAALGFATAGVVRLSLDSNGLHSAGVLLAPNGSNANPSYAFESDTNTGIYRAGASALAFAANGLAGPYVSPSGGSNSGLFLRDGTAANPNLAFDNSPSTGLYRVGANNAGMSANGALVMDWLAAASGGARVADLAGTLQTVGYRQVPRSTTATTLAVNDVGKCVAISAAINIPISTFSAGDAISIYNDSAGALNLTISGGTLRLAGTATTGTRSIASRGICTIWFNTGGASPEVIASGNVT